VKAPGRLIAFEGGEASGKSTQAARLASRLGAVLTREPGGTSVGEQVRDLLLDPHLSFLDSRAEALLMAAARAQHVAEVVRPALSAGVDVVTDRYAYSSLAYQGAGRGLPMDDVRWLSHWATEGLWPDVVVFLDVPDDVARARLGTLDLDRFENEAVGFHERVIAGFRALAGAEPDRWVVVDGSGSPDEVAQRVWSAVAGRLGRDG
jgi:dTMP kinase